jgi:hypothetical protein
MRIGLACFFVALSSAVLAPSAQEELHARYGEPNLERFMARPGIAVTVEYGSDRSACWVLIEPPRPLFHAEENLPLMLSDTVTEILEEIAATDTRGTSVSTMISNMGCAELQITQYQALTINRSRNMCLSPMPEHEVRATITYNRDVCQRPQ